MSKSKLLCPVCNTALASPYNYKGICSPCVSVAMDRAITDHFLNPEERRGFPVPGTGAGAAKLADASSDKTSWVAPSGAKSSERQPRYDLVPAAALRRVVRRFELGAEKHGEGNWKKGIDDPAWLLDRVNHAITHLYKVAEEIKAGYRDKDDNAAAVAWAGLILSEGLERICEDDNREED